MTSSDLVDRVVSSRAFQEVRARLDGDEEAAVEVGNLIGSSAPLFCAALSRRVRGPLLVVVPTVGEARGFLDDLRVFGCDDEVVYLPTDDESGFLSESDPSVLGVRVEIAALLTEGSKRVIVVASLAAMLETVPEDDDGALGLALTVGCDHDRDEVAKALEEGGFERVSLVESPGQFAVRGGVLDVYDHVAGRPWRIELFGDEIESIRAFDPMTQRSVREVKRAEISLVMPGGDAVGQPMIAHVGDGVVVTLRDPDDFRGASEVRGILARADVELSRLPVESGKGPNPDFGAITARGADMAGAVDTLDALSSAGEVTLYFPTTAERDRFWRAVKSEAAPILAESLKARPIVSLEGGVFRGFVWRDAGVALVNHRELFDIVFERHRKRVPNPVTSRAIDDFVDLEPGDYVVHVAHGIGRYCGIESMEKGGEMQEFLTLEFKDEVRLYVPVAKTDLVQKYIGGKGEAPRLSPVGGRGWTKKKEDVLRACMDLAADMLETQAVRERDEGFAHAPDTPWQHEMEASFPFEETPDQLTAIDAIKADMEAPRPMDRLLCGDVGYGKTEVAMRAVFKAVMSGKQVAVLVPTTVLAEQHLQTFRRRMAGYPVHIAGLSRFRSRREQQEALVGVVEGNVDVVIGTHRLLSKDVSFKDLGLVVIDEEQRFGVAHKEKLRTLRRMVDVLTMSATPIPRTLHQSLLGIRDISSLTQPPAGRQPVETKIVRYDPGLIRAAVLDEIERGGQCFFVHNRVQTIDRVRRDLREIVPEASVLVIHGQQKESEIEKNLVGFLNGQADILLATTIIESGLDITTANTMFIDRPDMYGLADLHQLRGRVGRQRVKAHAYLLLRPDVIVTGDAEKRLRAIEEFGELGSGFRIAMRDLEIRGAGNLLGSEQSGHITAIGYDLYCRLLEAAVKNLKKQRSVLPEEVDLNFDFPAYLPESYVDDPTVKLEIYRRLGRSSRDEDFAAVEEELRDRFGRLPEVVRDFIDVCRIRALAQRLRLLRVAISPERGLMVRPSEMKPIRRRLVATQTEHRVIEERDILLPRTEPFARPVAILAVMEDALLPEKRREREEAG